MPEYVNVGKISDFPEGQLKPVSYNDEKVGLVNVGGQLFAFERECTHVGADLTGSDVIGKDVVCWLHGSVFDVETGEAVGGPANDPLKTYLVQLNGEDVLVGQE